MKTILQTSIITAGLLILFAPNSQLQGATTKINDDRFVVSEGVAFSIGNSGSSHFLLTWSDTGGSFTNELDVTLVLTLGQTYTFQRTSTAHPFVIMDSTAAGFMSGSDGSFLRTSTSSADINGATLKPIADFTANPSPTTDLISWTPTSIGDYYYTCAVVSHTAMAGKIVVIPEPTTAVLLGFGTIGLLRRRRSA